MIKSTDVLTKFATALKKVSSKLRLLNRYARRLGGDPDVQSLTMAALVELLNLWVKSSDLFKSQRSVVHWPKVASAFDAAETELGNFVKAIGDIVQVEAAFGKVTMSAAADPLKMLLQGEQDDELFPINTLEKEVPRFFCRTEEVRKIEEFMNQNGDTQLAASGPPRKFVLSGLGGNGKTTTALAYAHKLREDGRFYDAIIWVGGETVAQVDQSFMKLAVKLNLPVEEMTKDPDALKLRIKTWLEKTSKSWPPPQDCPSLVSY